MAATRGGARGGVNREKTKVQGATAASAAPTSGSTKGPKATGKGKAPPQLPPADPNADWEDRVRAAVGSLRELVIIFTGITLTASFTLFISRHVQTIPAEDHASIVLIRDTQIWAEIGLLFLLVLSVMRFYYGNVMIWDRYYLLPGSLRRHARKFGVDAFFILLMTFGLAVLGLVVQFPSVFFLVYGFITLCSVVWLSINIKDILAEKERKPREGFDTSRWQEEGATQFRWFYTNLIFLGLIGSLWYIGEVTTLINSTATSTSFSMTLSPFMFWSLLAVGSVNSLYDLIANRHEYFPKYKDTWQV